jgi:two-component system NarL family sensor kinase
VAPEPTLGMDDAAELDQLRRSEAVVARLRWLGIVSWAFILRHADATAPPPLVYGVYAASVLYTVAIQRRVHGPADIRRTAIASTAGDALIVAAICAVTGGLASDFYPYFYLTLPATAMRFGTRETALAFGWHTLLSAVLVAVPGAPVSTGDLALRVFYLGFSALIGGLLSREARTSSRHARAERDKARQLLWRLIHVEEDERKRVAGEIHDRMGRQLFELTYGIDRCRELVGAESEPAGAALARLGHDARACSDTIRTLMNELRPPVLDDFGFTEALREYVAALATHGGLAVALDVDDAVGSARPEVNVTLFRILQEAVVNVRKHAAAARLSIEFRRADAARLRLVVRDDGRGFDPTAPARGHFGLLYMRERAEACGGVLAISSAPGAGTEIAVTVPAT